MANIKSAEKRARQALKHRAQNRAVVSEIHSQQAKLRAAIEAGDKAKSETLLREYSSLLDKGVKHGVIKANTAGRGKSRSTLKVAKLK